ncbi:hypothetical protein ACS0TY_026739 [Phlomoides rotata]
MGKREKHAKAEEYTSSEEDRRKSRTPIAAASDDDAEANEDLSLKIVQKSKQRIGRKDPRDNGASEIVTDFKEEKGKKEKKKRKKSKEIEVPGDHVAADIDTGFRDFCGELFLLDNVKKSEIDKAAEVSSKAVETNPVEVSDNVVLRKLLRGPRYFDPPDNNWGACYNCGEEGHVTANCTSAKRKKPCFVCGNFEHNAKQCSKGRDCFICKQHGHRAKDCPEKNNSSKICLKCGDMGHNMFACRNDYCLDDLKEIQCYICGRFGHLCCRNYSDPGPREVSCYRCGLSGHTGLSCLGSYGDANVNLSASSCYKCGLVGHFARECTTSMKASKRNREPSTPKQRSSKRNRDYTEPNSAPHDFGKTRKKKNFQSGAYTSASKTKHRGGWSTEDPGDYYPYSSKSKSNNWRTPSTPNNRRSNFSSPSGDYAPGGSPRFYQHRYSASRFGNSNGDMGRNNNYW